MTMSHTTNTTKDYQFRLYVAGASPGSVKAIANMRHIGDFLLAGEYGLEIIDIYLTPERASLDDIIAVPTLILDAPGQERRVIGDLGDHKKVLAALSISPIG